MVGTIHLRNGFSSLKSQLTLSLEPFLELDSSSSVLFQPPDLLLVSPSPSHITMAEAAQFPLISGNVSKAENLFPSLLYSRHQTQSLATGQHSTYDCISHAFVQHSRMETLLCFPTPLLTPNVSFSPHPSSNSLTPAGCPTIQFSSDTPYPEGAETPQVKGSVPQAFSHFRHQLQLGSPGDCISARPTTVQGFPRPIP